MIDEPKITLKVKLDDILQTIGNKVTSWSNTPSNDKYPSEKLVKDSLDNKISKSNTSGLIKNDGTVDTTSYSTFDGNYNNLTNKPTIPSNTSDLNNDSSFITDSDIVDKEDVSNKVTDLNLVSDDDVTSYPTANAVKDGIEVVSNELDDFSNKVGDIDYLYSQLSNSVFGTDSTYGDDLTLWNKLYYNVLYDKLYCFNRGDVYDEIVTLYSLTNYVQKSNTVGLLKNDGTIIQSGTGANNWATGNHTHSEYVNPTIIDNLTTDDATKVLSAKQGKVLNDMIGDAISYINGSGN